MTSYKNVPREVLESWLVNNYADVEDWERSKQDHIRGFERAVKMITNLERESGDLRGELWLRNNDGKDGVIVADSPE